MFVRGGVYRVVKEAMGGTLAKLSVSALLFDYVLTGPISAVSAGQYLAGFVDDLSARLGHPVQLDRCARQLLCRRLCGAGHRLLLVEEHPGHSRIQREGAADHEDHHRDGGGADRLVPDHAVRCIRRALAAAAHPPRTMHHDKESLGWLFDTCAARNLPLVMMLVGFGHSVLAMSGEESLAQVNREIEHPKLKNLEKTGLVIFLYSLLFTSLVSFFAVMIIPDKMRPDYFANLISGLAMYMVGPYTLKLIFQGFVVLVGVLILSGAVNTAIVGANGVLNRISEDGVLTPGSASRSSKYGTTLPASST